MIGLYKDPKVENILAQSNSGDPLSISTLRGTTQQQKQSQLSNEDALRRRVKQLEDMLYVFCLEGALDSLNDSVNMTTSRTSTSDQ